MARVGFIGTGVIADAMVRGIAEDGHQILVSERNANTANALALAFCGVRVADNQSVIDASDIVILCLMDDAAREVLPGLNFHREQTVFSAMARFSNDELCQHVGPADAGGTLIPFPFIARGNSPILTLLTNSTAQKLLEELFGGRNTLFHLQSTAEFKSMMALQAIVLPSLTRLCHAVAWAESENLDPVLAEGFLRHLVGGFMLSEPLDAPHLKAMAASLGTPGGLNATLDQLLSGDDSEALLKQGLVALKASLEED